MTEIPLWRGWHVTIFPLGWLLLGLAAMLFLVAVLAMASVLGSGEFL